MTWQITSGEIQATGAGFWSSLLVATMLVAAHSVAPQSPPEAPTVPQRAWTIFAGGERGAGPVVRPAVTEIAYWYGADYRTPFVLGPGSGKAAAIARNAIEYKLSNFWSMGSTFADVMVNQSDMSEPAAAGGVGATELYATLRTDVGMKEATGASLFGRGPVREIAMELGANLEAKNSSFAPAERTLYFGPKFEFKVPKGYLNVGLHLRKEWNHEGVLGKAENYDPDLNIEPTWMLPFQVRRTHLAYSGFADYNTQKGTDSFGSATAAEFLVRNYVALDLGGLLLRRPQLVDLNCGFWYWHNEYGKPSSDPGASQMTPLIGMTVHLGGLGMGRMANVSCMSETFKSALNVLLVEDDKELAGFVRSGLEEESCSVKVCHDGGTGLRQAEQHAFDILVLDVMLPVLNGFEITKRLRMQSVRTPILLLTGRDAPEDIVQGLDAGADDYLTKPFNFDVLLARIRARTRTAAGKNAAQMRFADLFLDTEKREAVRAGERLELTRTEFSILETLMRGAGRVIPRSRIIDLVWGDREVSENNLDVFMRYLRAKVDRLGLPRLIHTERGLGYSVREGDE